jgi:hypothetical protein
MEIGRYISHGAFKLKNTRCGSENISGGGAEGPEKLKCIN